MIRKLLPIIYACVVFGVVGVAALSRVVTANGLIFTPLFNVGLANIT